MYAIANENMVISDVINPCNEDAFKGYMQALRRYVTDESDLDIDDDKLILWLRSNDDHEECIRLFEDTLNICSCTGDVKYSSRFGSVEVTCDDQDVLDLIYKSLMI